MSVLPILVSGLFKPITDIINNRISSKAEKERALAELNTLQLEMSLKLKEYEELRENSIIESQQKNIEIELSGKWYQRNWRPTFSWAIIVIIINNYIIYPYISIFTDKAVFMDLPEGLWNLFVVAFGGYTVGRSAEKIFKNYSKNSSAPRAVVVQESDV